MDGTGDEVAEDEGEPQDAVPGEFLGAVDARDELPGALTLRVSRGRLWALVYGLAAAWPFLGTYYEYTTLNDSGAMSNVCDESGCVELGTEFAHQAVAWLLPLSVASVLAVRGMHVALRALSRRRGAREPKDTPVSRFVLVGLFIGVCVLALLLGTLRGMMINHFSH